MSLFKIKNNNKRNYSPADKEDLVAEAIGNGVVKVENGPSALLGGELDREFLVVAGVSGLVNDDRLLVIRELVDDVLVLLANLQVVIGAHAVFGEGDSTERLYKETDRQTENVRVR